jgi:glycosyltransferase involved in cell wall biosynthesis
VTRRSNRTVHLVAPATIDDPARPSGGNVYDRRLAVELERLGVAVRVHATTGGWPHPTTADLAALEAALAGLPADDTVLVDGLVASAAADVVGRLAGSVRVVVLVHQPLGVVSADARDAESAMLGRVAAVVTTSEWTRQWLSDEYDVPTSRLVAAVPGADPAELSAGTADGRALLCVGAVTPGKGHDVLVDALAELASPAWHCTVVGSLDIDPEFARRVAARAEDVVPGRVDLVGPLVGDALDAAYRSADVLVLPSRTETYGMVVTEALAHGLPVIASAAGGVHEALGRSATGAVPGITVPPGEASALAAALRTWLDDPALRAELRDAAAGRRRSLPTWQAAALAVATTLGD